MAILWNVLSIFKFAGICGWYLYSMRLYNYFFISFLSRMKKSCFSWGGGGDFLLCDQAWILKFFSLIEIISLSISSIVISCRYITAKSNLMRGIIAIIMFFTQVSWRDYWLIIDFIIVNIVFRAACNKVLDYSLEKRFTILGLNINSFVQFIIGRLKLSWSWETGNKTIFIYFIDIDHVRKYFIILEITQGKLPLRLAL